MHPCVLLTVAIVHPAYLSTIPVVLFLVFSQPLQSLSLVAVSSLSLDRLFTRYRQLFHCLFAHRVVVLPHREVGPSPVDTNLANTSGSCSLCRRQVFFCHLETGRAHRIALLHVHVFEALVDVSSRCYDSVP